MNPENITRRQLVFFAVLTEGGMAAGACLLGWLLGYPPTERVHWNPLAVLNGVLVTLPMVVCFFLCVWRPVGPLVPIKQFVDGVVKPMFQQCTIPDLAFIALLAGLGEEFLFRGVLQPVFVNWWGLEAGIVAASVLFGLAHPITTGYVILASLVGLYLGMLAYAFDNLVEVILAHALYDFIGLVYLVRVDKSPEVPSAPEEIGLSETEEDSLG